MRYRLLGNTGLRVSELFLGRMAYGASGGLVRIGRPASPRPLRRRRRQRRRHGELLRRRPKRTRRRRPARRTPGPLRPRHQVHRHPRPHSGAPRHRGAAARHPIRRLPHRHPSARRLLRPRTSREVAADRPGHSVSADHGPRGRRSRRGRGSGRPGRGDRQHPAGLPMDRMRRVRCLPGRTRERVPEGAQPRSRAAGRLRRPHPGTASPLPARHRRPGPQLGGHHGVLGPHGLWGRLQGSAASARRPRRGHRHDRLVTHAHSPRPARWTGRSGCRRRSRSCTCCSGCTATRWRGRP